ncbi:MAG: hypothetical protein JWN57_2806, partial [Frankiales bacterium]|nr:hypothetical protein [Frankiales bacterium]
MSTPLYDGLLSEVLAGAHVHRDRLATARAGIDRLHGPDAQDLCSTCRAPWPCATRRLVDGLARGDLDATAAGALVQAELEPSAADTAGEGVAESDPVAVPVDPVDAAGPVDPVDAAGPVEAADATGPAEPVAAAFPGRPDSPAAEPASGVA